MADGVKLEQKGRVLRNNKFNDQFSLHFLTSLFFSIGLAVTSLNWSEVA